MNYELSQRFYFEAAHTLERAVEAAGSRRIHGHTYHAEVTLSGQPDTAGMVLDLGHLRAEIAKVRELLDHHFLDEVDGLGAPTIENLCSYIFRHLSKSLAAISSVTVERSTSGDKCVLRLEPVRQLGTHAAPASLSVAEPLRASAMRRR